MPHSRPAGDDLRPAILDATRRLLVQEGYYNLSMRKIARAVGCSATSIYLHFENKDALLHALIDEGFGRLNAALDEAFGAYPDPVRRLDALSLRYIRFGLENPELYEVMFLLHAERMDRYPAEKYRRARRNLEYTARTIRDGLAAGVFAADDAEVAAAALWASLHGAVSLMLAQREDVRIMRAGNIEAVVRQATVALREPAAAAPPAPGPA